MKIELDDSRINGQGHLVYAVSVIAVDGENLGTAVWLADSEDHLEEQLMQSFIHDEDWDQNIAPDWRAECIGKQIKQ